MERKTEPAKLRYTWDEYARLVDDLAVAIRDSGYRPGQVIGIASGGLFPADALAKLFRVPLGIMVAKSYERGEGAESDRQGELVIGENVALIVPQPAGRILLVDDLTDTGRTMTGCMRWMRERFPTTVTEVRTALIWHKSRSVFRPDYHALAVERDADGDYPWIITPQEAAYEIGIDKLRR